MPIQLNMLWWSRNHIVTELSGIGVWMNRRSYGGRSCWQAKNFIKGVNLNTLGYLLNLHIWALVFEWGLDMLPWLHPWGYYLSQYAWMICDNESLFFDRFSILILVLRQDLVINILVEQWTGQLLINWTSSQRSQVWVHLPAQWPSCYHASNSGMVGPISKKL